MSDMIKAEEADLATHVQLCAIRHAAVERRMTRIERAIYALLALASVSGGASVAQVLPVVQALAVR